MHDKSRARFRSLGRVRIFPGVVLLLLGCEILGYIHLGSFALELGGRMISLVKAYPAILLVAGFVWIVASVFWEDIKPLLSRWSKASVHERVSVVEVGYGDHQRRLTSIETRWENAKISGIHPRLLTHSACLQKIALLSMWMDDLATFIYQAEQCHLRLSEIIRRYPASEVARAPFSKGWKPNAGQEPADEATRLGLMWAAYIRSHIIKYGESIPAFGKVASPSTATHRLTNYVAAWDYPDVTPEACLATIEEHKKELDYLRSTQAANFADPLLQRPTIS